MSLFGELLVDEITTKVHLPFYEGKSRLIYKFHLPHTPQMRPHRDFRDDSSYDINRIT